MEAINFLLDDLGVEGTEGRFSEAEGWQAGGGGLARGIALALLERLQLYDSRIVVPQQDATLSAVVEAVRVREPQFAVNAQDNLEYRLLHLLCTHLQGERLLRHSSKGGERRELAAETGKSVFQLEKICNDLDIDTSGLELTSEMDILRLVTEKVQQTAATLPPNLVENPPKVLPNVTYDQLSTEQLNMLARINEAFGKDFLLRRQMLMKRLDVTIQSFLWGEKAQGKEGEVVAAIQAQRRHLSEQPTLYAITDALQAPVSLLHEHSKRVTDQGSRGKKNLVKTVLIGHIPDRGGRANEMRPKKSDLGLHGGGGGGGRGGGRGGGGGGGGRGGGGGGGGHNNKGRGGKGKGGGGGGGDKAAKS